MKNKWKDISVIKKIFCITLLSMIIILTIFLATQTLIYGKLYSHKTETALKTALEDFSKEYTTLTDKDEINRKISEYSLESNAYIMVADNYGIKHAVSYEMVVETDSKEQYRFSLDSAANSKDFKNLNLSENTKVNVTFMQFNKGKADIYIPETISTGDGIWNNKFENAPHIQKLPDEDKTPHKRSEITSSTISGTVQSIVVPVMDDTNMIRRSDALDALMSWLDGNEKIEVTKGAVSFYTYENPKTKNIYRVAYLPTHKEQYVFGVLSIRHVGEAVNVFRGMIVPALLIAMVIALIVGWTFSRVMTKPIVTLTRITTKMKDLDFREHCTVHGQDEIGVLATNINEMSDKLDMTIKELVSANEKLRADIDRERTLEKQRREFVAAVSHELKTPLAIIRAYAEGIADGVSENKQKKYIDVIVSETKKMDRLVLDMLENSKLEAGAGKLNIHPYSLTKIAEKYINLMAENFKQNNIILSFTKNTSCTVPCDCDKIEQVVSNFLSNALKNTPSGGRVDVEVAELDDSVYMSVENTGKPIPDKEIDKIWDKFYKCDKARDRADSGTGLGLSIAKNILILHNANYRAENTERGVRFFFELKK